VPLSQQQREFYQQPCGLKMALPDRNPFICYDLTPKELETESDVPTLLQDLPGFKLWHLQDNEFRVPKGVMYIAIDSPHLHGVQPLCAPRRRDIDHFRL